jgi:hypothetical protein
MERTGGGADRQKGSGMTGAPRAPGPAGALAAARVLAETRSVLVIDWPSRDVPASLAFAGFTVLVKGRPGPGDYAAWEPDRGEPEPLHRAGGPSH